MNESVWMRLGTEECEHLEEAFAEWCEGSGLGSELDQELIQRIAYEYKVKVEDLDQAILEWRQEMSEWEEDVERQQEYESSVETETLARASI